MIAVIFALADTTHPPSPRAAYVNAAAVFIVISGFVVIWGLFDWARSLRQLRR
jgi:hypothetical protein